MNINAIFFCFITFRGCAILYQEPFLSFCSLYIRPLLRAMESAEICRFETFWVRIFVRRTFLLFI